MKKFTNFQVTILLLASMNCPAQVLFPSAPMLPYSGPYLGQTPPDSIPVRFAPPGLTSNSTWFWHGSPSFSPDLTEMFFVKYYTATDRAEINYMKMIDGNWTIPTRPSFASNVYIENNPFFSPTGDTLYFYSQRPGGPFFYVVRQDNDWSVPIPLYVPYPDSLSTSWQFFIARDKTFYLDLWQQVGDIDIYTSRWVDGSYIDPVKIESEINSPYKDWGACLDSNGTFMIFASDRPMGMGLHDLYISYRIYGGSWTLPVGLGSNVNGPNEDGFPYLSPDGKYLFYTTARAGDLGYNPYWVKVEAVVTSVGVDENLSVPNYPELKQNYPNPTRDITTIEFTIKTSGNVRLQIFDYTGRQVKTLIDQKTIPGTTSIKVNTSDMKPGIYFYTLFSGEGVITRKMIVY